MDEVGAQGHVTGLALTADETMLAVAREYAVELCDAATGRPIRVLGHGDGVRDMDFSPDGRRLVTAADDGRVRVWDVGTGEVRRTIKAGGPGAVRFFPDGERIAAGV